MMPETLRDHSRLADLTRRYASFSRSAGGASSVLGGALVLITYFVGALVSPSSAWGRIALASAPIVWLVCRELLRSRYYQKLGRVEEPVSRNDRRLHVGLTVFVSVISIAIVGLFLYVAWQEPARALTPAWLGYIAFVAALPWVVWKYLKTPLEFIIGVFLVAQAALMLGGGHYSLGEQPQAPIAAVVLIVLGVRQHMQFQRLRGELQGLGVPA